MATDQQSLSTELQQQLDAIKKEFIAKAPPEVAATMREATEELIRSGIAKQSLSVGAKAPDFTLPSVKGEEVALSRLLANGPVVLTFYRGAW